MSRIEVVVSLALALSACGDKKRADHSSDTTDDGKNADDSQVEQLPTKPLGVISPRVFNFKYGKGSKRFRQIEPKAKGDSADYQAVIEGGKQVLESDPGHLGAHFLLGIAYANTGAPDDAIEHLSTALAGDWLLWGPTLAADGRLQKFFQSAEGKAVLALNEAYKKAFAERASAGLLVAARRSGWKKPAKPGAQYAASRAELYSYDLEHKRYLRLTHTGDSVIGFIESPSKDRIAYLSGTRFRIVEADDSAFVNARVGVLDAETFLPIGERARLAAEAVEVMLHYAEGEELRLHSVEPDAVYSVDHVEGALVEIAGDTLGDFEDLYARGGAGRKQPLLYATLEMARVLSPWGAVEVATGEQPISSYRIESSGKRVGLPKTGGTAIRRVTLSPNGGYTTFVGIANPCDGQHQSALYVADTATASPKHVHRGKGLHNVRWLDDTRFAFEADKNEIRIYDAAEGRVTHAIENRAGIALSAISNAVWYEHCPKPVEPDDTKPALEDAEGVEDGAIEAIEAIEGGAGEGENEPDKIDDSDFED